MKILFCLGKGPTAFYLAAENGHIGVIEELLLAGANTTIGSPRHNTHKDDNKNDNKNANRNTTVNGHNTDASKEIMPLEIATTNHHTSVITLLSKS
jgi:hypothetical protein